MASSEGVGVTTGQPNLYKQDLSKLDVKELTALSPEVISRQATINIGTIGHVAHGKSTVVKAISGVQTVRFKNELERNITIKLERLQFDENGIVVMPGGCGSLSLNGQNSNRKRKRMSSSEDENAVSHERRSRPDEINLRMPREMRDALLEGRKFIAREDRRNSWNGQAVVNGHRRERRKSVYGNQIHANGNIVLREKHTNFGDHDREVEIKVNGNKQHLNENKPKTEGDKCKEIKLMRKVFAKEYVVEKVVKHKIFAAKHYFYVKWNEWSEEHNTWEPINHMEHSPLILLEFLSEHIHTNYKNLLDILKISDPSRRLNSLIPKDGLLKMPTKLSCAIKLLDLLSPPTSRRQVGIDDGKKNLYNYLILEKRERQLQELQKWEDNLNATASETAVIKVENNADLELPPKDFIYINSCIMTDGVKISSSPTKGCNCNPCGGLNDCCGVQQHRYRYFQYFAKGRINMPPGCPIYECNSNCKCNSSCRNRVVQNGRHIPLQIFRTTNGCGWGIKTLRNIVRGEFICEYVGEVLTHEEAERRGKVYDARGRTYLFDLDYNSSDNPYTIDAAKYGNVSHFINHSCEPNAGVWAVWIECSDLNLPRLALFALRSIMKGEELTFDYRTNNGDPKSPNRQKEIEENKANLKKMTCKCNAKKCRKFLFG